MGTNEIQVCARCVYDTTIPGIVFDGNGICQYCKVHDELEKMYPLSDKHLLDKLVEKVKKAGKGKRYDCIVGLSGGVDSTYTIWLSKKLGLRPLAVHFDNGWNSEKAVHNIRQITNLLGVDLVTHVADWEEFKDLQLSFLKASTSDAEIPTDVTIDAVLHKVAYQEKVKYIFLGTSFRTEGIVPLGWTYMDGYYISSVHKKFGKKKITSFPEFKLLQYLYYNFICGIKNIPVLNYVEYNKEKAGQFLQEEIQWKDLGGHHHESIYTHFFQSYYLPTKFGIDKRKLALSARIRSKFITRDEALKIISTSKYPYDEKIVEYTRVKLGLSEEEFKQIITAPVKHYWDYPTYYPFLRKLKWPITVAFKMGLIPKILYFKFFS